MTISHFSVAMVLLSISCGLRSPFGSGANQSTTGQGGQAGTGAAAAAAGAGGQGPGSGFPFGAPAGGGTAAGGDSHGPVPVGGREGTGATSGVGLGSGSGSSTGAGGAGSPAHVDGSGVGSDPDSSTSGAGGGTATKSFAVDGGVDSVDAAVAAINFDGGDIQAAAGDAGLATTILFPDAGVITYPDDPAIPSPLPSSPGTPAVPGDGHPSLSHDVNLYTTAGCGEPPACFIRASVVTSSGHAYGASFSSSYPKDNCARDYIKDDDTFLIGDTFRSAPQAQCTAGTPLISVAFNVEYRAWYVSSRFDIVWTSDDGFRSEWQLANGSPGDNGSYYPIPGDDSRLEFFGVNPISGESHGQLQVPLINSDTGIRAVGYVEFDVFLR